MLKTESIARIRESNLYISDTPSFPENHVAYPSGYMICKPASVEGNGHEFAESWFDDENEEDIRSISPAIIIWNQAGQTNIELSEYAPGPGPSDFKESFDTEEKAVKRIIRYYFDPNDPKFKIWYEENERSSKHWQ